MFTISNVFNGTTEQGQARMQFVDAWKPSLTDASDQLRTAFGMAGRGWLARADEWRRVMGVG